MKYRKLGGTGLEVSVIGIGADQFSGEWEKQFNQNEVNKILNKARQLGINFLDTAECYGDHLSESFIGNAIKGNREEWIIATKFGHKYKEKNKREVDFTPEGVLKQLDKSLECLKTDYIDVYQFHSGNNSEFDQKELWDMLKKQVKKGKIKHLGISIMNSLVLKNDLYQLKNTKNKEIEIIQVVYNRLNHKTDKEVIPYCVKNNIGVIGRVPLAKGHLTGKYPPGIIFPKGNKRLLQDDKQTLEQLIKVQEIKKKEVPKNINMVQWALAWCLKNPQISTIIPGCKNLVQLEINANASKLVEN